MCITSLFHLYSFNVFLSIYRNITKSNNGTIRAQMNGKRIFYSQWGLKHDLAPQT